VYRVMPGNYPVVDSTIIYTQQLFLSNINAFKPFTDNHHSHLYTNFVGVENKEQSGKTVLVD
jgi:hypothetical protein